MGLGGQMDSSVQEYVCALPEEVRKVALKELREDDCSREQSLQQMRDWIKKHPNIKKCRTDAPFLLRFLRTKKFSVPQACEMIERYLIIRQLYPQWFTKLDCNDKDLSEIIGSGYLVPLPERDAEGRIILFSTAGKFDPHKFTAAHMARVHSLITESLMDDETNQVNGYAYVNDEAGFTMAHISLWSLTDIRNMLRCIQNSTPMRHKSNHFLNISSNAVKLIEFAVSLLSEKLKSRIFIHKSLDELHKQIDPKILPKEYGGQVPLADMIDSLKKKLAEKRDQVVALDEMYIEIDEKSCPLISEMNEELGMGLEGSFKKLQVD
ncbi:PREDICTED: clavesin-2 [Nicrophorus vespilloides]|uniref:Clavesin-2 n=1 Tax=Nicrophorus vespilloides TaxID=110193 RepID=A0ABM1MEU1_NICVS|nr:PREDICTED: clavesin-2 [Nicrophorus vespilloides]XP_017773090.1 PREDICTED: clavesin-2 [Nicrophorus vespilloides]XP_017773091.1 PREDICTED: clavesin-2 [Nicrophorus vespilloides]